MEWKCLNGPIIKDEDLGVGDIWINTRTRDEFQKIVSDEGKTEWILINPGKKPDRQETVICTYTQEDYDNYQRKATSRKDRDAQWTNYWSDEAN